MFKTIKEFEFENPVIALIVIVLGVIAVIIALAIWRINYTRNKFIDTL